jgi:3-oxocholest-4-en-26-oyl-CoA dehydrogenase beta subunit
MDFDLTAEAVALRDLSAEILGDHSGATHRSALSDQGVWFDAHAYRALAQAGILGAALPESVGGAGLGFLELHQVLEQVGATNAQVPLWESLVLGADPIVRHGSPDQQARHLPPVVAGEAVLTAALIEPGGQDRLSPRTRATQAASWTVTGLKTQVPMGLQADCVLISASVADGRTGLFIVDPNAPGVTWQEQVSVSGRPVAQLTLVDAPVEPVGHLGAGVLEDAMLRAETGLAALQAGVCAKALRMTADYTSGREQFGQPLAAFQAVRQRLADAYIDVEAVRLTSLQAAWMLASGEPGAARAVAIAKYWACEAGHRVLHSAHHLHGGIGIDLDYDLHRYYRFGKYIEMTLGTARDQLRTLGRSLADGVAADREAADHG